MTEPAAEQRAADGRAAVGRGVGLGLLAFAVGYVFSDVDRACGAVAFGAAAAGVATGLAAGADTDRAVRVSLGAAVAYFAGLFTNAAVHDKLNLLPFAVAFMAMFTGIFLVAAVLGRLAVRSVRR